MSWQEVALVAINALQLVALTWISARQQQVKHELEKVNGRLDGH